jgi:hypothetical protein
MNAPNPLKIYFEIFLSRESLKHFAVISTINTDLSAAAPDRSRDIHHQR